MGRKKFGKVDPAREWVICHPEPVDCPICSRSISLPIEKDKHTRCHKCGCLIYNDGKPFITHYIQQLSLPLKPAGRA